MKINADVNAKKLLTKEYMLNKHLIEIQAIVDVNVINQMMLENIQIIKTVNAGKGYLINQLKNVEQ